MPLLSFHVASSQLAPCLASNSPLEPIILMLRCCSTHKGRPSSQIHSLFQCCSHLEQLVHPRIIPASHLLQGTSECQWTRPARPLPGSTSGSIKLWSAWSNIFAGNNHADKIVGSRDTGLSCVLVCHNACMVSYAQLQVSMVAIASFIRGAKAGPPHGRLPRLPSFSSIEVGNECDFIFCKCSR